MQITETKLKGCLIIEPTLFNDDRGYFFESYNAKRFNDAVGQTVHFVQDNISVSKKGVLRGLHYQTGEYAQAKLIHVIKGAVLDVVVDLRKESATFGQHFKLRISEGNRKSIFIPKGMAHGFLAMTEEVIFAYKCDAYYDPKAEAGIIFNDPYLNIDWEISEAETMLSEKDLNLPKWENRVL